MVPESPGPGEPWGCARVGTGAGPMTGLATGGQGRLAELPLLRSELSLEENQHSGEAKGLPEKLRGAHPKTGLLEIPLAALFVWQI